MLERRERKIANRAKPHLEKGENVRAAAVGITPAFFPLLLVVVLGLVIAELVAPSLVLGIVLLVVAVLTVAITRFRAIVATDKNVYRFPARALWPSYAKPERLRLRSADVEAGVMSARIAGGPPMFVNPGERHSLAKIDALARGETLPERPPQAAIDARTLPVVAGGALVIGVLLAAAISWGSGPPDGDEAVAEVGDEEISRGEFNHWIGSAAKSQQPPGGGEVVVPDPPNFTRCVQSKQGQPPAPGAPRPTPADLKEQCKQEYESLKTQVMQFLIQGEWIVQQAEELDISVTDAEIRQSFTEQKEQSFEKDEDYQQFLRDSGQTEADLLYRVEIDLLSQRIRDEIIKDAGEVTEADIQEEFNENKENFGQPELRDVRLIKTDNREDADKAKGEIEGGAKFAATARKYSTDPTSKEQGGELADLQKGSGLVPQQAEDAIFGAERGQLEGPIETDQGFYLFEVTRITPGKAPTLDEQTRQQVRSQLESERQQEVIDAFVEDFERDFIDKTVCAEDFLIPQCDNFKSPADTGPAYGGEPIGAPPIGPPEEEAAPPPPSPFGLPTGPGGAPPGAPPQGAPPAGP